MPGGIRFRLLMSGRRRSGAETIFTVLFDEQSTVPFHFESLGAAQPAALGVFHGETVAHRNGLHLLWREDEAHGRDHRGYGRVLAVPLMAKSAQRPADFPPSHMTSSLEFTVE